MAELTVTLNNSSAYSSISPKFLVYTETKDLVFTAPFAPKGIEYSPSIREYGTQSRPGRKPITTPNGISLASFSVELFIGSKDYEESIDNVLSTLSQMAASDKVIIVEYEPRTSGLWTISSFSYSGLERQKATGLLTRATVSMTFTEYSAFKKKVAVNSTNNKKKTYVVKQGDTLSKIAKKFYNDPNEWKKIADKNNIKPKNIKVGMKLIIP